MMNFLSSYDNQKFSNDLSKHHNKTIAVQFSGGVESTLLLYLTYKYLAYTDTNLSVKNYTINDVRYVYIKEFIIDLNKKVANLFNIAPFECIFFEGSKKDIRKSTFTMLDKYRNDIDLLINGMNSNPKTEVAEKWKNVSCEYDTEFDKDGNIINPFYEQLCSSSGGKIYHSWNGILQYRPLRNVDKRMVIDTYRNLNIFDNLYFLTRTCDQYENVNLENVHKHCMDCHACFERFEAQEFVGTLWH